MGSSSVSTHRGLVHCQGLLLVVSLLNFWTQPISAELSVQSIDTIEGKDVTLRIQYKARNVVLFLWYRGEIIGIQHNIAYLAVNQGNYTRGPPGAQAMVEDDGSLMLKNVTEKDTGTYTILLLLQGCQQIIACGRLDVHPVVGVPTLIVSNTKVTENKDTVQFTCSTNADKVDWFFNGSSLQYTQGKKLSCNHRVLTINPVQRWDAGEYHCLGSNSWSSAESNPIKLEVKYE